MLERMRNADVESEFDLDNVRKFQNELSFYGITFGFWDHETFEHEIKNPKNNEEKLMELSRILTNKFSIGGKRPSPK